MKRILLVAVITVASFIGANAQPAEGFQFGAGIRAALPIGDFADSHSFGIGAEIQGEFGLSEMISAVGTTGYTSFFGKSVNLGGLGTYKADAVGLIPILVGARVYPSTNFFIGAQVGYGILTGGGESDGAFNYQPQVGFNAANFQVAVNYNGLSKDGATLGHIGLTAIYKFGGQ